MNIFRCRRRRLVAVACHTRHAQWIQNTMTPNMRQLIRLIIDNEKLQQRFNIERQPRHSEDDCFKTARRIHKMLSATS